MVSLFRGLRVGLTGDGVFTHGLASDGIFTHGPASDGIFTHGPASATYKLISPHQMDHSGSTH